MTKTTPVLNMLTHDRLNCMEVWGGNGAVQNNFEMPGLDIWVWSKPSGMSQTNGGDVHFLSSCASGRITRTLLADICGQGSMFGNVATELRDLMMRNVNSIRQAHFMREMHERLQGFSDEGGYATALISTFFAPTKSFTLCNAGHASPLVYRTETREWSALKQLSSAGCTPDEVPPGVVSHEEYQRFATHLDSGDMVLLYSNAMTECKNSNGQTLGVEGLLGCLQQLGVSHPETILPTFISRICGSSASTSQDNDTTAVLSRATNRTVGWKNNVLAPFRLLGAVADKTRWQ